MQNLQSSRSYSSLIYLLFCFIVYVSCKKSDQAVPVTENFPTKEFFTLPENTDPVVAGILNALNRENKKSSFAEAMVQNAGYPQWSAAKIKKNLELRQSSAEVIINIPFVKKGLKQTAAILIADIKGRDTTFEIAFPQDYIQYEMEGGNGKKKQKARSLFNVFSNFDYQLFGITQYMINDGRIFGWGKKDTLLATVNHLAADNVASNGKVDMSNADAIVICNTITTCLPVSQKRDISNAALAGNCSTSTECNIIVSGSGSTGGSGASGGTGGGGSTSSGGNSGGSGTGQLTQTPCKRVAGTNLRPSTEDPCGAVPWTPAAPYVLSSKERSIWDNIYKEEADANNVFNKDCQGTNRTGNVQWPGTMEHWLIMIDYLSQNPIQGQVEYQIPGGSLAGNKGYADMVNSYSREIFEIKPNNATGISDGLKEVTQYVIAANKNCPPKVGDGGLMTPWSKGKSYIARIIPDPRNPLLSINAELNQAGVIVYSSKTRTTQPIPMVIPGSALDKIKNLIKKLKENIKEYEKIIAQYLKENPDLVNYLKGAAFTAAVAIIVGTIVEDFLTAGAGIADDWSSFLLAYRIIQFASKL